MTRPIQMLEQKIAEIVRFFLFDRGRTYPFYGTKEMPSICDKTHTTKEEVVYTLTILKAASALDFTMIDWDPKDQELIDEFMESIGQYNGNPWLTGGFNVFKRDDVILESIIKSQAVLKDIIKKYGRFTTRPEFIEEESKVIFQEKKCLIPAGFQFAVCKAIFSSPLGEWVKENDIFELGDRSKEKSRSVKDAIIEVNRKVKKHLNIDGLIEYNKSRARIRKELFR